MIFIVFFQKYMKINVTRKKTEPKIQIQVGQTMRIVNDD